MKVTISKANITSLMNKVRTIVPNKPQIPVLSNVLLEAQDDQLILSATDLTLSIKVYIDAQVEEEGSILLPAKRLFPLISELTSPEIEIKSTGPNTASILSGTSSFKILGGNKEEFPNILELTEGEPITLSTSVFKEMLSKTAFAAGKDETRPIFSSILLERSGVFTTFTGTDGKRLAKTYTDAPAPAEWQGSFILPHKAVEEMIRLLDTKEETLQLRFSTDKVSMQAGPVTLVSQLISGQYPDVSRIIPDKQETPIKLHREELITLLRQVSLFTSSESSSVRFTFADGELILSVMNGEMGEGRVSMPVNYREKALDIAFNPAYLLDILRHSKDETVDLTVKDAYNPGLITDSSSALFVIMPMRLET
jgi:DNA polymerase III subunit beta